MFRFMVLGVFAMGVGASTVAVGGGYDLAVSSEGGSLADVRQTPFSLRSQRDQSISESPNFGFVSTLGFADSGIAGVAASAGTSGFTDGFTRNASGGATANFSDTVTINGGGLNGTTGTVTVQLNSRFIVNGNSVGFISANAHGQWSAFFGSGGGVGDSFQFLFGQGGNGVEDDPYLVPTTITSPFTFGRSFTANLQATAAASLTTAEQSQFATIGHAIGFGGIVSIKDADGNEVSFAVANARSSVQSAPFATIISESGIDYLTGHDLPSIETVPEPASGLAALAGLTLLTSRRARGLKEKRFFP